MTMQVRNIAALVALAFCMPTMDSARQKTISFDPDQMEACEGDRPQGTPWQLPNVGVARLVRDLPGMNAVEVSSLFRGPDRSDVLTKDQFDSLVEDHLALRRAAAYHFMTPPGQEGPQEPSDELWTRIEEATKPSSLRSEVLPCGYVLQGGLTYRLKSEQKLELGELKPPVYVWWKQKGVFTPDGKPGIRVWVSPPFETPAAGMYHGEKADIILPEICGNMSVRYGVTETTGVTAPSPENKPEAPKSLRDAKPPEGTTLQTERVSVGSVWNKHKWPCTGKVSRWVCGSVAGGILAAVLYPYPGGVIMPTPTPQPPKAGSPGSR